MRNKQKQYILYKITNIINNKGYIGITIRSLHKRFNSHCHAALITKKKYALYHSMRKYGINNFKIEILSKENSWNELVEAEKKAIIEHNTFVGNKQGYNMTYGGEGMLGYQPTEETRQKISKAAKGRIISEETRKKLSIAGVKRFKENPHSEEALIKMSKSNKGKIVSEETRKKISKANLGKKKRPLSEEQKKKISEANTGKKKTPEMRERMSKGKKGKDNGHTGMKRSEKTKQKMRDIWKKRKEEGYTPGRLGKTLSKESRKKISNARRGI